MADGSNVPALTERARAIQVTAGIAGFGSMAEMADFAQLMAKGGPMVGKAFREQPGACLGIIMQASQWRMNPFAVSQKAFLVNDTIAYEAQLVIAVINANAPIKERLKPTFTGEGAKRQCTVTATIEGETEPCVYISPEVGKITPKSSPLWKTDEDQQLFYYSARAWARRYCPEIVMGVYTVEELQDAQHLGALTSEPVESEVLPFDGAYLKGKAKDEAVASVNAKIAAATTLAALEALKPQVADLASRVSKNAAYGLEEAYAQREHALGQATEAKAYADHVAEADPVLAVLNGQEPEAASPFEALKEQGLAVLSEDDGREDRLNAWAQALTQEALAGCTEDERNELRVLYRNVRAEVRP